MSKPWEWGNTRGNKLEKKNQKVKWSEFQGNFTWKLKERFK